MMKQASNESVTVLVVLYHVSIENSDSVSALIKYWRKSDKLWIWDNSTEKTVHDFSLLEGIDYQYNWCEENWSLSKVYNTVFSSLTTSYILVLDQDSIFDNLIETAFKSVETHGKSDLILPIIKFGDKIISPAQDYYSQGVYWNGYEEGLVDSAFVTAINSGMIISQTCVKKFLADGGYDERLRFYGVDKFFMQKFRNSYDKILVIDSVINHDSALRSKLVVSDRMQRVNDQFHAWEILYNQNILIRMIIKLRIGYTRLKLYFEYGDLSVFKK